MVIGVKSLATAIQVILPSSFYNVDLVMHIPSVGLLKGPVATILVVDMPAPLSTKKCLHACSNGLGIPY